MGTNGIVCVEYDQFINDYQQNVFLLPLTVCRLCMIILSIDSWLLGYSIVLVPGVSKQLA